MIPGYTKSIFTKAANYFQLGYMPTYNQFRSAINWAEMGGRQNQFIRTESRPKPYFDKKKGKWIQLESTAFGPGQITKGLLSGALKDYPEFRKKWGKFSNEVMMPMYKLHFANSDKNKAGYNKVYGYGGTSGWDSKNNDQYMAMYTDLLKVVGSEAQKEFYSLPKDQQTPNRMTDIFIGKWRGKTIKSDPRYFNEFYGYLNKNYPGIDNPDKAPKLYPSKIPASSMAPYQNKLDTRPGIASKGTMQYRMWQNAYNRHQKAMHGAQQQAEWTQKIGPRNDAIQKMINNQIHMKQPIAIK